MLAVPGVAWVRRPTFQRLGRPAPASWPPACCGSTGLEVAQLADDPSFPERGRLTLDTVGGL